MFFTLLNGNRIWPKKLSQRGQINIQYWGIAVSIILSSTPHVIYFEIKIYSHQVKSCLFNTKMQQSFQTHESFPFCTASRRRHYSAWFAEGNKIFSAGSEETAKTASLSPSLYLLQQCLKGNQCTCARGAQSDEGVHQHSQNVLSRKIAVFNFRRRISKLYI